MDIKTHNDTLAKLIQKNLKKDVPGVYMTRQGYKGTGSKEHRRQIFIRARTLGGEEKCLDIWLETERVTLGGVVGGGSSSTSFRIADRTPEESYAELVEQLRGRW